jgi:hypothetical protein
MHERVIQYYQDKFSKDIKLHALLLTGSVARGEHAPSSDLDLIAVGDYQPTFTELTKDGITVEIKYRSLTAFMEKMDEDPMNCYQFLDAKLICGSQVFLDALLKHAHAVLEKATPVVSKKWLVSAKEKMTGATDDELKLGFLVANNLWKLIEGIYAINGMPVPPMTTAYRNITSLPNLPTDFPKLWQDLLTSTNNTRKDAFIKLADFVLTA